MKKIIYAGNNTSAELLHNLGLSNKVVALVSSELNYKALRSVILAADCDALMQIKGIGPKTAEKIIKEGRKLVDERPDRVHLHIGHYSAPMYDAHAMLDSEEYSLLTQIVVCDDPQAILSLLDRLIEHERASIVTPLTCTGNAEYNSLPRSMLSDILGIEMGSVTDKICIFRHGADNLGSVANDVLYTVCKPWERDKILAQLDNFRRLFLNRAVSQGFMDQLGTHYVFYTASPGQLKKGSGYWMKEEDFNLHQKKFWGGLTPKKINVACTKKDGSVAGIVMTKTLQYRALLTSSAMPSSEVIGRPIRLRNMICVGEDEKLMRAHVMSVSEDYEVSEGEVGNIGNNMFDGWFALNERVYGRIHMQSRMYGIKGLGVSFDWEGYSTLKGYAKNPDCYKIVDSDGIEHDLSKEPEINVIMNTSVWKMKKHYKTWQNYVECMEQLGFDELYICAINEDESETKQLSRQMMQTLFAITGDELDYLSGMSRNRLYDFMELGKATDIMAEKDRPWDRRSNLGKLVTAYPEVMKLDCVQKELRDRYTSEYDSAMCGELKVNGRYFFAVSDPCAWADIRFGKKSPDDPTIGHLAAGECRCTGYPVAEELIALRSPHAFMEWTTLKNVPACCWLASSAMYFSVHDLTFRVLQMDFDGDHVLVVDDPELIKIVKRIKKEYNIPVIHYEPSAPAKVGPMPMDKATFSKEIVDCIMNCLATNKVGQYSNLATAAWSMFDPNMSKEEMHALIREIAVLAAGINHAVDAQKTYKLNELSRDIVKRYGFKPYNQRFKDANPECPHDDPTWDQVTKKKALGSVDRLGDIVASSTPDHLMLDTASLDFDWRMMMSTDPRYQKLIHKAVVPQNMMHLLDAIGECSGSKEGLRMDDMRAGRPIGFGVFFRMLWQRNANFFKKLEETEDDITRINWTKNDHISMIRSLVVAFIRNSTTPGVAEMSDDEVLAYAANNMLRNTFAQNQGYQTRHIFNIFGDIYAKTVMDNIVAGYKPETEDELDNELPDMPAFDPDAYAIPDEPEYESVYGAYDAMLMNEMSDLC